jgi:hypothetical protein
MVGNIYDPVWTSDFTWDGHLHLRSQKALAYFHFCM